ncbi:MAG: hypothetical protein ABI670_20970 [Chloroflexota bacterium]
MANGYTQKLEAQGITNPGIQQLGKIAAALNSSVVALLSDTPEEQTQHDVAARELARIILGRPHLAKAYEDLVSIEQSDPAHLSAVLLIISDVRGALDCGLEGPLQAEGIA